MNDLYKELEELCETVSKELTEANRKTRGSKLSSSDIDYLDKLTHMMKSIKTTMAMMEEGYSSYSYPMRTYSRDPYGHDYSERRDSMGRYSGRYSRDNDDFMRRLRELSESAPDDRTRKEFDSFMSRIETM